MQIVIEQQIQEFENDPKNIDVIFGIINAHLEQTGLYINHLLIDDTVVRDNFLNVVTDNINTIQKIEVITQTLNQGITQSFHSTNDHITRIIPLINELAKDLYENPNDEVWLGLIDLLETLEWMIQTPSELNVIIKEKHVLIRYGAWRQYTELMSMLEKIVPKLEKGINSEENEVMGDVLLDEVIPLLKKVKVQIGYLINYMMIC